MSECNHCWHDTGIVLTSYPEKYQLICCHCGEVRNISREKMHSLHFEQFTPPDKDNHGEHIEKLNLLNKWKFTHMSEEVEEKEVVVLSLKDQVEADKQRRVQLARQKIAEIVEQLECDLVGTPQYTADGRTVVIIQVVAK